MNTRFAKRYALAFSVALHVLVAVLLIAAPKDDQPAIQERHTSIMVYSLPQPSTRAETQEQTEPTPTAQTQVSRPKVIPEAPKLVTPVATRHAAKPKNTPAKTAPRTNAPVEKPAPVAKEKPAEPVDPFDSRVVNRESTSKQARKPVASEPSSGLNDGYKARIAQAIRDHLDESSDEPPGKGTVLSLQIDAATGRVVRARIQTSSGRMSWDNRSQAAAMNTTIPVPQTGMRPSTLTVYIHP